MTEASPDSSAGPQWRPLGAIDRRVLGVLAEKAKTTPQSYPLTLNSLCDGCNQKSNRYPQMQVEPEDVEQSLERLRGMGAVSEVQGSGRVAKFRHMLYQWLGVEKIELSVMTELLLRGAQTEGELRGRVERMDPIPDLTTLRSILDSLRAKGLVISLTPEGRGHVVTHALYQPEELAKVRAQIASDDGVQTSIHESRLSAHVSPRASAPNAIGMQPNRSAATFMEDDDGQSVTAIGQLRQELETVRDELAQLRRDLDDLRTQLG